MFRNQDRFQSMSGVYKEIGWNRARGLEATTLLEKMRKATKLWD